MVSTNDLRGAWMYKNAEGYRDETACRAIIAVAREERIKRRKQVRMVTK